VLRVDECWNFDSPVFLDQYSDLRYRAERYPITKSFPTIARLLAPRPRVYPAVKKASLRKRYARYNMDYLSGVADLAQAVAEQRPPVLSEDFCLHVTELLMAIQRSDTTPYEVTTTFQPQPFLTQS